MGLLIEGRIDDVRVKYPEIEDVDWYRIIDISSNINLNHKYLQWISSQINEYVYNTGVDKDMFFHSLEKVMEKFVKLQQFLKIKDLYQYDGVFSLDSTLDDTVRERSRNIKDVSDSETIYEDDVVKLVRPLTHEASCYYGAGTKWCTSSKDDDTNWENYSRQGMLFYLLHKNLPTSHEMYKTAIHMRWNGKYAIYDSRDKLVGNDRVDHLNDKPQIMKLMKLLITNPPELEQMPELLFSWRSFGSGVWTMDGHVKDFNLSLYEPKIYDSHNDLKKDYPKESTYIAPNMFNIKGGLVVFVRKDLT